MSLVYLVRHAKAKNRSTWSGPDRLRPLAKKGRRQAAALPSHFGSERFSRLVSSPAVRCVGTLEPLGAAQGLEVETADALAEGAAHGQAIELMLGLASERPVACCTHADVLLAAVEDLVGAGLALEGPPELPVAGTWVLEARDGRFVAGRYLAPPE